MIALGVAVAKVRRFWRGVMTVLSHSANERGVAAVTSKEAACSISKLLRPSPRGVAPTLSNTSPWGVDAARGGGGLKDKFASSPAGIKKRGFTPAHSSKPVNSTVTR